MGHASLALVRSVLIRAAEVIVWTVDRALQQREKIQDLDLRLAVCILFERRVVGIVSLWLISLLSVSSNDRDQDDKRRCMGLGPEYGHGPVERRSSDAIRLSS